MVKKCPDPACGFEGDGKCCSECGKRLIEKLETTAGVVCNGKTSDGQPCGKVLTAKHKFCSNCGYKVEVDVIECQKCWTKISTNDNFCFACGGKVALAETEGN